MSIAQTISYLDDLGPSADKPSGPHGDEISDIVERSIIEECATYLNTITGEFAYPTCASRHVKATGEPGCVALWIDHGTIQLDTLPEDTPLMQAIEDAAVGQRTDASLAVKSINTIGDGSPWSEPVRQAAVAIAIRAGREPGWVVATQDNVRNAVESARAKAEQSTSSMHPALRNFLMELISQYGMELTPDSPMSPGSSADLIRFLDDALERGVIQAPTAQDLMAGSDKETGLDERSDDSAVEWVDASSVCATLAYWHDSTPEEMADLIGESLNDVVSEVADQYQLVINQNLEDERLEIAESVAAEKSPAFKSWLDQRYQAQR